MSNSQSYSTSSYTTYSSSSSQSGSGPPQTTSQRYAEQSYTDPASGTTTRRVAQNNNGPAISQTVQVPVGGGRPNITGYGGEDPSRRVEDTPSGGGRITDVDQEYEERMEDEYAKKEGGA